MKCSKCSAVVTSGAAWGPCVPGGHLTVVCSACNVAPIRRPLAQTAARKTPAILTMLRTSLVAVDIMKLVSDPVSRRALVAAIGSGRVVQIDGNRVISVPS